MKTILPNSESHRVTIISFTESKKETLGKGDTKGPRCGHITQN